MFRTEKKINLKLVHPYSASIAQKVARQSHHVIKTSHGHEFDPNTWYRI